MNQTVYFGQLFLHHLKLFLKPEKPVPHRTHIHASRDFGSRERCGHSSELFRLQADANI